MCGEHRKRQAAPARSRGSSPRVRGTPRFLLQSEVAARFIPACAGNTLRPPELSGPTAVHPRVCGEHHHQIGDTTCLHGSSPRVRGTRCPPRTATTTFRFIPACAGNTPARSHCCGNRPVHPRVCGEHPTSTGWANVMSGSSPRVRGTHRSTGQCRRRGRFIPACAGNTPSRRTSSTARAVHPRVCGEHTGIANTPVQQFGSSPRVRGTPPRQLCAKLQQRFIPACAGNTTASCVSETIPSVHPRVCGEHCRSRTSASNSAGSSPRVRGTLLLESIDLTVEFQRAESYRKTGGFRGRVGEWRKGL